MNPLAALSPWSWSAEDAFAWALAGAAFLVTLLIWYALLERDPKSARTRRIARLREELMRGMARAGERKRSAGHLGRLASRIAHRLKLVPAAGVRQIRERLEVAGLRSREAVAVFLVAKFVLPLTTGLLAWAGTTLLSPEGLTLNALLLLVTAVFAGFYLPDLVVRHRTRRRLATLQKALPDALDMLVICAEAGLSLQAGLQRVADEIGGAYPELAEELSLTAVELTFLPERRQALHNLARRIPIPTLQGMVSTLIQTERYGTPLAPTLRVLANELREQRILKAEEKAARLPAVLTVPLILFILPALFIVLAGPAMIDVYDNIVNR